MRNQLFIIPRAARESLDPDEVDATIEALKELSLYALPYPVVDVWVSTDGFARTVLDDQPLGAEPRARPGQPKVKIGVWSDRLSKQSSKKDATGTVREWVEEGLMTLSHDKEGHEQAVANFGEGAWVEYKNVTLEGNVQCYRFLHFEGNKNFPNQRLQLEPSPVVDAERLATAHGLIVLLATRNATKTIEHHKCARLGIGTKKGGRRSYEYVTTISVPAEAELPPGEGEAKPTGATKAAHLRRGHIRRQRFGPRHELVKRVWIAPVFVNADRDWVSARRAYNMSF